MKPEVAEIFVKNNKETKILGFIDNNQVVRTDNIVYFEQVVDESIAKIISKKEVSHKDYSIEIAKETPLKEEVPFEKLKLAHNSAFLLLIH